MRVWLEKKDFRIWPHGNETEQRKKGLAPANSPTLVREEREKLREGGGNAAGWDKSICNIFYGVVSGTVLCYCI